MKESEPKSLLHLFFSLSTDWVSKLLFAFRRLTIKLANLKNGLIKDEKHYQIIWTNIRRGGVSYKLHEFIRRSLGMYENEPMSSEKKSWKKNDFTKIQTRTNTNVLSCARQRDTVCVCVNLYVAQCTAKGIPHIRTAYNSHLNSLLFHLNANLICAMVRLTCAKYIVFFWGTKWMNSVFCDSHLPLHFSYNHIFD